MNTTEKGDNLESKILKLFKREIAQGRFFSTKNNCKIFSKKGYYSKDRKKNIVFDISVEIYLPGHSTYSMLVLIECKNYNHSVPVDDAEEFHSKIQQVSGAKGIIVSTNSFQEGAVNFAKSKGIGLIRYYNGNDFKWELTRSPSALISYSDASSAWSNAYRGINSDSYPSKVFDCYCYSAGEYTNSLRAFLLHLLFINIDEETKKQLGGITTGALNRRSFVEYRDDLAIEETSREALKSINYTEGKVPLDRICAWQSEKNNLKVTFEGSERTTKRGVLGMITFNPLEIKIYRSAEHRNVRERFTLAHELGHHLLGHSRYMAGEYVEGTDIDVDEPAELGLEDIMRMEWQANYFASCLLLPKNQFTADFSSVVKSLNLKDRGFGAIYLDEQRCNLDNFYKLTTQLTGKYGVSREVMKIRLKKMGLLNESRKSLTIPPIRAIDGLQRII